MVFPGRCIGGQGAGFRKPINEYCASTVRCSRDEKRTRGCGTEFGIGSEGPGLMEPSGVEMPVLVEYPNGMRREML